MIRFTDHQFFQSHRRGEPREKPRGRQGWWKSQSPSHIPGSSTSETTLWFLFLSEMCVLPLDVVVLTKWPTTIVNISLSFFFFLLLPSPLTQTFLQEVVFLGSCNFASRPNSPSKVPTPNISTPPCPFWYLIIYKYDKVGIVVKSWNKIKMRKLNRCFVFVDSTKSNYKLRNAINLLATKRIHFI